MQAIWDWLVTDLPKILAGAQEPLFQFERELIISLVVSLILVGLSWVWQFRWRRIEAARLREEAERNRQIYESVRLLAEKKVKLEVRRILDPRDPDLDAIAFLHERLFKDNELRDNLEDFQRWLAEDQEPNFEAKYHVVDIMLVLKSADDVIGYMYAQHYLKRHLVVISYIGIDPTRPDAIKSGTGVRTLLSFLLALAHRPLSPWHGIIGEVEYAREEEPRHGSTMFGRFRIYASNLEAVVGAGGQRTELFRLDFDYRQPPLNPDHLRRPDFRQAEDQYLMYLPRDLSLLSFRNGEYWLTPEQASNLFQTLLLDWYAGAHGDNPEYVRKLQEIFDEWSPRWKLGIRLISATRGRQVPVPKTVAERLTYQG